MIKIFDPILNLVFPPRCEVCRKSSAATLCGECFASIKFMKPQYGIHCVAPYEGVLKTALHRLKFQKRKKLAEPLGVLMVNYLGQAHSLKLEELDSIIPVPLHPRRLRERGFNQAELLAQVVGKYYERPVLPSLGRIADTKRQFDLPKEARRANIKGAFKVTRPRDVYDKRVLLLDDIYTTGATVAECVKVLSTAGARRIEILTLARAVVD